MNYKKILEIPTTLACSTNKYKKMGKFGANLIEKQVLLQ